MRFLIISAALAAMCCLGSCKKDDSNTAQKDYLIFGTAYGMCVGDCTIFYKIEGDKLYADDMVRYNYVNQFYFKPTPLSSSQFQQAVALQAQFPAYLLQHPDTTYGCPDCADQGGFVLQLRHNGLTHTWHLDTDTSKLPPAIRPYLQQVRTTLGNI